MKPSSFEMTYPGITYRPRPIRRKLIAFSASLALLLAACGSSDSSGTSATAGADGGKSFTYALTGLPTSLDPADYQGDPSRNIGFELGSSLFRWGTEDLPSQGCDSLASVDTLKGELADSWERSTDGLTITVKLRAAKSSFGNAVTAEDVKWTFDRLIALEVGTPRTLMTAVADYATDPIAVVDPQTFQIKVNKAGAMDLAILTWHQFRILDSTEVKKHVTDADPWGKEFLANNSAYFGPWQQVPADFDSGNRLTLTPNPNYWGERGDVTSLVFQAVPDATNRAQLLKTGNADYAAGLAYDQYESLKTTPNVELQTCASADRVPLVLNAEDPALADPDVRRAISMAIDRDAIVKSVYRGLNRPALYGLSQAYEFATTPEGTYTYDVAQAKTLMSDAGASNLTINLQISPARPGPEAEQIAILLKSQLAEIGITVNIQTVASATEINTIFHDGTFQAMLYLEPPAVADPYYSLFLYNSSKSALNTFGYKNDKFDELTEQIGSMDQSDERKGLIAEAAEVIVQDPPFIYLVDKQFIHALSNKYTNYQHAPNGEIFVYTLKSA